MKDNLLQEQEKICKEYKAQFIPAEMDAIIGVSNNTNGENIPINGLRHPEKDGYSGWYIWSGEEFSEAPDFFKPIHVKHLVKRCPQVMKLLGLPPGYRFLIDDDGYVDVWYDEKLLGVDN